MPTPEGKFVIESRLRPQPEDGRRAPAHHRERQAPPWPRPRKRRRLADRISDRANIQCDAQTNGCAVRTIPQQNGDDHQKQSDSRAAAAVIESDEAHAIHSWDVPSATRIKLTSPRWPAVQANLRRFWIPDKPGPPPACWQIQTETLLAQGVACRTGEGIVSILVSTILRGGL
jgi:hypothetical protein